MSGQPPLTNARGVQVRPRPGPAPGSIGRRGPEDQKIERAEKWVSDYVRAHPELLNSEDVISLAIQRMRDTEGLTEYCLVKAGPGSNLSSAWFSKWKARWGFRSRRQHNRVRCRRNGVELREELFTCWRRAQACMKALNPEDDPTMEYFYVSADETGLWTTQPAKAVVANEQLAMREPQLQIDG
eukprot:g20753.t1